MCSHGACYSTYSSHSPAEEDFLNIDILVHVTFNSFGEALLPVEQLHE